MSSKTRRKPIRIACTVRRVVAIMISATLALSLDPAPLFLKSDRCLDITVSVWTICSRPEA